MKFAAAMTLYNPAPEMIDNLKKTAKFFDLLYVYDNTEEALLYSVYSDDIKSLDRVTYLWNGFNDGLPIAFNKMIDMAEKDQVDFLCTLDQDSILTFENVEQIEKYIIQNNMAKIAAVAPFPTGTKKRSNKSIEEVEWAICSGCFLNLSLLKRHNIRYDEAYFIDRFDVDICMQIRRKGLKIIRLNDVKLKHHCGDDSGGHSDIRHYYMFRNRCYYNYKYYCRCIAIFRTLFQNLKHLNLKQILVKHSSFNRRRLIFYIALNDFKTGKMGKINIDSLNSIERL